MLPDQIAPFRPANCGFRVHWSAHLRARFAGRPLKRIALRFGGHTVRAARRGFRQAALEGGAIYALSAVAARRDRRGQGPVTLSIDLRPDLTRDGAGDCGWPARPRPVAADCAAQGGGLLPPGRRAGAGGAACGAQTVGPRRADQGAAGAADGADGSGARDLLRRRPALG